MIEKIKNFFRKIFRMKKLQYIEAPREEKNLLNQQEKQSVADFRNQIILDNKEKNILELQQKIKSGIIQEEDLTEEEFLGLTKLYESQIEKTKQTIQMYKDRIIAAKSKIAQNN